MQIKINKFLTFFIVCGCLLSVAAFNVFAQKNKMANNKPRVVHEPNFQKMVPKFLSPQGFLDPKFSEAVAKPSPYLTDFFGIQALANTTKEGIKRDFVPKFAEVVAEDENTLELKFKNGYSGKFYPHSILKVVGQAVPNDHVEISGATWQELVKNLEDFRATLRTNKLEKHYLIPNPFYKEELLVAKNLSAKIAPAQLIISPTLAEMKNESNAVLLYGEGVHGNIAGYEKFKADVLDKYQFDWIGLEMLTPAQQKDLDIFVKAADGSAEYVHARKALTDYFTTAWNGRNGKPTTGEENYYFKIVDQMRAKKTRVVGIEASTLAYIFFRYGETKFGAAVRSLQWAQAVPKKGRGLVFGGNSHFNDPAPINFQDFLKILNPKAKVFVLQELKMRSNAD